MNRLNANTKTEVVPSLVEKFNYKSIHGSTKSRKIAINMGVMITSNAKNLEKAVEELILILVKNQL